MNLFDIQETVCIEQWNEKKYKVIDKERAYEIICSLNNPNVGVFAFLNDKNYFCYQVSVKQDEPLNLFAIRDPGVSGACPKCKSNNYYIYIEDEHKEIKDKDRCCFIPHLESYLLFTKNKDEFKNIVRQNIGNVVIEIGEDNKPINKNIFICSQCSYETEYIYDENMGLMLKKEEQ